MHGSASSEADKASQKLLSASVTEQIRPAEIAEKKNPKYFILILLKVLLVLLSTDSRADLYVVGKRGCHEFQIKEKVTQL